MHEGVEVRGTDLGRQVKSAYKPLAVRGIPHTVMSESTSFSASRQSEQWET